jgi:hypothetical protein
VSNAYQFLSEWRVAGTIEEVKDILGDGLSVPQWWPAVYLHVTQLEDGGEGGLGRVVDMYTKGWLPYTLRWTARVTEPMTDAGYTFEAVGDLAGTGRWTFVQDGPEVVVTCDWRIEATKPLLRRLGWLLRPAFSANHRWAMKRGEQSLRLEMRRRRARTAAERASIPPPPPTAFGWVVRKPRT